MTLGHVATRCGALHNSGGNSRQLMSRSMHQARGDIHSLQLIFARWYLTAGNEVSTAGDTLLTAAIEYPVGQFTQVKWDGSTTGEFVCQTLASDFTPIYIPDGETFYVRSFQSASASLVWTLSRDEENGEACTFGPSGVADQTMGGTIQSIPGFEIYRPLAVIAATDRPSVAIIEDSRGYGVGDVLDSAGDKGNAQRSLSPYVAFTNLSRSGDQAAKFVANHDHRLVAANHCSDIFLHLGINDNSVGRTEEQIIADLETIVGYFPGKRVWLGTIEPKTTSTDGWVSISGQTVDSANAVRIAVNNAIRAGLKGASGYFDIADVLERGRNSGVWRVYGGQPLTDDGLHSNRLGYQVVEDSGVIDPRVFFPGVNLVASPEKAAKGQSSRYLTAQSLGNRPRFKATKDGIDQTGVAPDASVKVTFPVTSMNVGRYYDEAASLWVPPPGVYRIRGQVSFVGGIQDQMQYILRLRKNGIDEATWYHRTSGPYGFSIAVETIVEANGAEGFEICVKCSGAGDKTIGGNIGYTFFEGAPV